MKKLLARIIVIVSAIGLLSFFIYKLFVLPLQYRAAEGDIITIWDYILYTLLLIWIDAIIIFLIYLLVKGFIWAVNNIV